MEAGGIEPEQDSNRQATAVDQQIGGSVGDRRIDDECDLVAARRPCRLNRVERVRREPTSVAPRHVCDEDRVPLAALAYERDALAVRRPGRERVAAAEARNDAQVATVAAHELDAPTSAGGLCGEGDGRTVRRPRGVRGRDAEWCQPSFATAGDAADVD